MTTPAPIVPDPTLEAIEAARERLGDRVRTTPSWRWDSETARAQLGPDAEVHLKLELFQATGSFKPRGALLVMLALSDAQRARGVTAVSAGNHALAVAYAARLLGTSAIVAMPRSADPARIEACRAMGADVRLLETVHAAFEEAQRIEKVDGRAFVHPFEGEQTVLGTATVGLEFMRQVDGLDAVVVPIGGGGLAAGVALATKLCRPQTTVIGVEPVGADSMHRSFAAGQPASIEAVRTIADSLGAPYALPYTFELCRRHVDRLVHVDDDMLERAMFTLFREAKLAVEPAGAAATAAVLGPLAGELAGRRVGVIICGANVAADVFARCIQRGGRR